MFRLCTPNDVGGSLVSEPNQIFVNWNIQFKKMSQYNTFKAHTHAHTDYSPSTDYGSLGSNSKLYSSERLAHADLSCNYRTQPPPPVTANQLYFNLNSSLDGLLSKIEAIKQEHTVEQKNAKPPMFKKMNMDVSGFPMPNLAQNQLISSKQLNFPSLKKLRKPNEADEVLNKSEKAHSLHDDHILFSPSTGDLHKQSCKKPEKKQESYETVAFSAKNMSIQDFEKPMSLLGKNKDIMNIPASHLKVSMNIPEEEYGTFGSSSKLESIIDKSAHETDVIKHSIIFGETISLKDFELGKNVGSGKFGDVHICRHRKTGTLFALKKIFKSTILEYNMVQQFTRELKIHYKLSHPNIINLYTHFDDEYHIFLLMEYAEGGILMNRLKCTEEMASRYVDQANEAVQYLHKLKIAHRDIKPENIVLQFGDVVKLCDFGWASFYDNEMKTTFCGTLDYLSPEMKEGGQYDNSVDVWSIGVLTYELLTGNPPYRKELMLAMKNGAGPSKPGSRKINWTVNYPQHISSLAESFIRNLLKENPEERATLRFCSTHTFLKKYRQNLEELSLFSELNPLLEDNIKPTPKSNLRNWKPEDNKEFGFGFHSLKL